MTGDVDWPPPLLSHHQVNSIDDLYAQFCRDFIDSVPSFGGKPFQMKRHPMRDNREATFWHVISTGEDEATRRLDRQRCRRIGWPRALIDAVGSSRVVWWRNRRGRESRVIIALPDFSYVVVLAERDTYVLLWTAYHVEREHRRRKLRREYEAATND